MILSIIAENSPLLRPKTTLMRAVRVNQTVSVTGPKKKSQIKSCNVLMCVIKLHIVALNGKLDFVEKCNI